MTTHGQVPGDGFSHRTGKNCFGSLSACAADDDDDWILYVRLVKRGINVAPLTMVVNCDISIVRTYEV